METHDFVGMLCSAGLLGINLNLRSNMWSSETLATGLGLVRGATLSLETDPEAREMHRELIVP